MKLSKIACVALFSGLVATQSFGAAITGANTLAGDIAKIDTRKHAADVFVSGLKELESLGYSVLSKFVSTQTTATGSTTQAQADANVKINAILAKMANVAKDGEEYNNLPNQAIVIGDNSKVGNLQLEIIRGANSGNAATIKIGKVAQANQNASNFTAISQDSGGLKDIITGLTQTGFKAFSALVDAATMPNVVKNNSSALDMTSDLATHTKAYLDGAFETGARAAADIDKDAARINTSEFFEDSINKDINNKIRVLKAIDAYNAADKNKASEDEKKKLLSDVDAALKATGLKINNKTGETGHTVQATDILTSNEYSANVKNMFEAGLVAISDIAGASAKLSVNTALEIQKKINEFLADVENVQKIDAKIDTAKTALTQFTINKTTAEAIKNNNVALAKQALIAQANALATAKQKADKLNTSGNDTDKKAFVVEAAKLGVKFQSKTSSGTEITADNVNKIIADTAKFVLDEAFSAAKTAIETAAAEYKKASNDGKVDALLKALDIQIKAQNGRIHMLSKYITNGANSAVLGSFADIQANNVVSNAIYNGKTEQVVALATNISNQTDELAKTLKSNGALASIKFNNNQLNQTRLAKLANPYNKDLALAKAIKKLDGEKLADNGNALSSVIKGYTDRFENSNNLWADIIGSKVILKDGPNPELYGFSVGYDRAFDNFIVGGYASYAKSKANSDTMDMKANNYELGIYSRAYIDQNEIDTKLSYGFAKNKISSSVLNPVAHNFINNDAKFDSKLFNIEATYGYVIDLGDALYIKPLVGLNYENYKADGFKESGDLPKEISGFSTNTLSAKLGVELRKYLSEGHYLFITPAIKTELVKSKKDIDINFVGSNQKLLVNAENKKKTYAMLNAGAEAKLNDALSMNVNLGIKAASKEQHYNATLGLKYAF